ncbi:hypothetical protein BACCAP_00872 [Pseudoflavonifractor capillosus ATCC 29799]|uniref:Uncharacterized protein n=1 Tax=Pseudoflavonifractor capillosus ATCC 29799 TaxID=411467 RepID=A6NRP4_9FIRM|nr:hypothetical protein BACCAP_00872 [Pseudoflavonifractor capillosus ATCC 29799]
MSILNFWKADGCSRLFHGLFRMHVILSNGIYLVWRHCIEN